ncbi:hypothetical protein B0T24DRAFT_182341 [Lasiosphaeria ovina]|uniref:Uncharacterized protein n=1 Tax=Lasiosphaeria ovina TaxID=92902 RepID=A0AAE0TTQ9_9PEZI|nr:hypothetical protein B0T24DRAFT_182341 [Lasiosphaeria ovina]
MVIYTESRCHCADTTEYSADNTLFAFKVVLVLHRQSAPFPPPFAMFCLLKDQLHLQRTSLGAKGDQSSNYPPSYLPNEFLHRPQAESSLSPETATMTYLGMTTHPKRPLGIAGCGVQLPLPEWRAACRGWFLFFYFYFLFLVFLFRPLLF